MSMRGHLLILFIFYHSFCCSFCHISFEKLVQMGRVVIYNNCIQTLLAPISSFLVIAWSTFIFPPTLSVLGVYWCSHSWIHLNCLHILVQW